MAFSLDDSLIAAGTEDALVRVCPVLLFLLGTLTYTYASRQVWSVSTKELIHTLQGHSREIYALEFIPGISSSSYSIASSSGDRSIFIWSLTQSSSPSPTSTPLIVEEDLQSPNTVLTALAVSPDGKYIASGNLEGQIRLWSSHGPSTADGVKDNDGREWKAVVRWQAHEEGVYSVRWASGNVRDVGIVTGSLDKTLKRWTLTLPDEGSSPKAECMKTMAGHKVSALGQSGQQSAVES